MTKAVKKIIKLASLMAIAISASACVSSDKASQNAIEAPRPFVMSEPVSQKLDLPYEQVAQLQISQQGAAQLLAISHPVQTPVAETPAGGQIVSRNTPLADDLLAANATPTYRVASVYVDVPTELSVSEANRLIPKADIVWREDPLGDRRAQVANILQGAIAEGAANLQGNTDAILSVKVHMFHAISEKARYTVGGRHNIQFDYVLLDAVTGQQVSEVKSVNTKLKAYGGRKASAAEQRGETQKVRITRHVAELVRKQLQGINAL